MPNSSRIRPAPYGRAPLLEQTRVRTLPPLRRIAIGVDPGHEAGIVVAALGDDGHGYILEDLSLSGSPGHLGRASDCGLS